MMTHPARRLLLPLIVASLLPALAIAVRPRVSAAATLSGQIHYYSNGLPVAGASVRLDGPVPSSADSDANGAYAFPDVGPGTWSIEPSKLGDTNEGVSALDAVYVLQAALGLRALSAQQRLACDVTGNGAVSALDAAVILQYALGLITQLPVAQACGSDWTFVPEAGGQSVQPQMTPGACQAGAISVQTAGSDVSGQDFSAVLFGDCSGNWQPVAPPPLPSATATRTASLTPTFTPTPSPTATFGTPTPTPTPVPVEHLRAEVLNVYPHDTAAFTEGLILYSGALYESTGLFGSSSLRQVDPPTGQVTGQIDLDASQFGEGLERVGSRLIQLTWQNHLAFVYDLATFAQLGQFTYATEGWGLCFDGQHLVMSDGTSTLYVRDPDTFAVQQTIPVTLDGQPLIRINELECVGDQVYANVWLTSMIVRIDRQSGVVGAVIDASGLLTPEEQQHADVLNGIAYNPQSGTFLITGKYWPKLFEVHFVPVAAGGF